VLSGGALNIPQPGDTGLVVMPPPEIRTEINMWRRVYRAYESSVTPHITICYPFVPVAVWDAQRRVIPDLIRGFHAFDIVLRELGTFVRDESVLWLKPEDGRNLVRIRTKMQELFSKYLSQPALAYVPHLTIGLFQSVEELFEARKSVQKQLKPLRFTVDRLIFAIYDKEGWRIHDYVNLSHN
jgi:2'-5' RNA ligase